MKKSLLYCLLPLLFFSCKKSEKTATPQPVNSDKTYTAHFDVSTSTSNTKSTNSLQTNSVPADAPLSAVANKLFYYVYNSSGQLIAQLVQDSTATNFGQITDTFSPGSYNIVMVAYRVTPQTLFFFVAPSNTSTYSTADFKAQGCDAFFKTFSLTVTNSAVTQSVELSRVVGQLQIEITDAIPAGTTSLQIQVVSDLGIGFSTGLPGTDASTLYVNVPIPASAIGKTNFIITTYVGNTSGAFTVNLSASNSAGVFATAMANNITCPVNTRTLLSGDLFSQLNNDSFTVSFDKGWDNNPITIPF